MPNKKQMPDPKELHKSIKDLLSHDPYMIRCVLGNHFDIIDDYGEFNHLRGEKSALIVWMGNLLTLSGIFLYSKFNKWCKESKENIPNMVYLKRLLSGIEPANFTKPSAAIRVLRVLDGLYDSFDMNFAIIKYIITNSQIEAGYNISKSNYNKNKKRGGLSELIGFPDENSFYLTCEQSDSEDEDEECFYLIGQNLTDAFYYVSLSRGDPDFDQTIIDNKTYDPVNIACAFSDVFKTMDFMRNVYLEIDDDGIVNFKENGIDIPSCGIFRIFKTNEHGKAIDAYKKEKEENLNNTGFYLLDRLTYHLDEEKIKAALCYSYQSFDETNAVKAYFSENDKLIPENGAIKIESYVSASEKYKEISGHLPGTRATSSFFRGMLTAHYRYHNILALSIVDAIDGDLDAKKYILDKFVRTEPVLFKETFETVFKTLEFQKIMDTSLNWEERITLICDYIIDNKNKKKRIIDWDTLTARILFYEGPTQLLDTILLYDDHIRPNDDDNIKEKGNDIIAGLKMRYSHIFNAKNVSDEQKNNYKKVERKVKEYSDIFPVHGMKMNYKMLAQSYIDAIVQTLTNIDIDKRKDSSGNKFAENSIYDSLDIYKKYNEKAHLSEKEKQNTILVFLQTIMAFLSFYAGIHNICSLRVKYEFQKSMRILSSDEIKKHQRDIEDNFYSGVMKKADEFSNLFNDNISYEKEIETALKELLSFANNMSDKDLKFYVAVLARPPIDKTALEKIFFLNKEKNTIYFLDENDTELSFEQIYDEGKLVIYLNKVLCFLANEDASNKQQAISYDKSNYINYKEFAKKVIYPQVVTYAKRREDCDSNRCLIMDHSGAFSSLHNGEVQILTEFNYKINQAYYVLPNISRIETEWWIDPLLISCYDFDEKIKNKLKFKEKR